MTTVKSFVERRKHKRFRAEEGTLAEFHKTRFFKIGKPRLVKSIPISDISSGGIGFQYSARDMWPIKFDTLTISNAPDEIRIDNVPFKTVSDFPISRPVSSKSMRRCGVKFGELTSIQKSDLSALIQKHTISNHVIDRRTAADPRKFDGPGYNDLGKRKERERRKIKLEKNK
ncbi:MAG: hypothetical protein JRJ20_17640 [Deltaproteobacteria bacterium]|nr:hypothetical protein [Deltaproteobacteria bacterium]